MAIAPHQFFATCPRGLEALLKAELEQLGAHDLDPTDGGVGFGGDFALCYSANLQSRFATRILWRIDKGNYRSEEDIYQAAYKQAWQLWFNVGQTFMVKLTASKSPLKSL